MPDERCQVEKAAFGLTADGCQALSGKFDAAKNPRKTGFDIQKIRQVIWLSVEEIRKAVEE